MHLVGFTIEVTKLISQLTKRSITICKWQIQTPLELNANFLLQGTSCLWIPFYYHCLVQFIVRYPAACEFRHIVNGYHMDRTFIRTAQ